MAIRIDNHHHHHHHHHHQRMASMGHSVTLCPCLTALHRKSAGEKPLVADLLQPAVAWVTVGVQVYASMRIAVATPVMHLPGSAELDLLEQPWIDEQYGQTMHISSCR